VLIEAATFAISRKLAIRSERLLNGDFLYLRVYGGSGLLSSGTDRLISGRYAFVVLLCG
jgi:hypothetical protein